MTAPIGYFVHHQGRGHVERCAALVNALPDSRPVTIFCARDDIFPALRPNVGIIRIPSLFEPTGAEPVMDWVPTPATLHCAPLGWHGIRTAMTRITSWFAEANPALMVCDVSAEVAQLARICSVPHIKVLQHGDRRDPGHRAAYDGAAGILAPFHSALAQPDWNADMLQRTYFAPGLGCPSGPVATRAAARERLALDPARPVVLVMSGKGGNGFAQAPIAVGARAMPDAQWITVGQVARDWHATEPANLQHLGWVDGVEDHIAAADLIVASTGNTTCQQILNAGRPWIAVPEWRYFDEQVLKARALHAAGVALHLPSLPSSAHAWQEAVATARSTHDPARQQSLAGTNPAPEAAMWLEGVITRLWGNAADNVISLSTAS
ncbi:glycosyltransferase [Falsirhodobacter sp. alg1]|uniref:glycosyltransferase n=1 Tax=Falsirhodobacter sp. alg1 TaxID=1472418 RepID=UPI0005F07CC5|nr:glycosyltransferase [Falsirhodobacter sp. alg1]